MHEEFEEEYFGKVNGSFVVVVEFMSWCFHLCGKVEGYGCSLSFISPRILDAEAVSLLMKVKRSRSLLCVDRFVEDGNGFGRNLFAEQRVKVRWVL